jgi:hypothetical protein
MGMNARKELVEYFTRLQDDVCDIRNYPNLTAEMRVALNSIIQEHVIDKFELSSPGKTVTPDSFV